MKNIYFYFYFFFLLISSYSSYCQHYVSIPIQSGFNADVIANGIGTAASSTTHDVDGVNYTFVSTDYKLRASQLPLVYGLPKNGLIKSFFGPRGLSFQLASYSQNNDLRLPALNDSGTLVFNNPVKANTLYMLAAGGSGNVNVSVIVNFADSSTQTFASVSILNWYDGVPYVINDLGRINRKTDNLERDGRNPNLYHIPLPIDAGNYNKEIKSITITKTFGGYGIANIFAFSADEDIPCENPFTATISKTDVSCNGGGNGSATITPDGTTAPYNYSWAPRGGTAATATGLTAGIYTVTITDANSCQYQRSITIEEPPLLTATTTQTDALCNGTSTGTATVIATGGTGSYTYSWAPSGGTSATAVGLSAGNYNCSITDSNGCFTTSTVTIKEPTVLSAATSQINATCTTSGQASVTPSGGTSPYTYLWSTGAETATASLPAGYHSCVITDSNNCTITKNFTIGTTNTLVATQSKTDNLCNGGNLGSAKVVPSGAPGPFTYVWAPSGGNSDTATGLIAGNYSVTITAGNGCSIVKNFTITEPTAITLIPSQTNILCNGGTAEAKVTASGGTGSYTYNWSPSGGTAATATNLQAGTYVVTVTDANGCQTTQAFTITEPDALKNVVSQTNVSCKNGNNGTATVSVSGGRADYTYNWLPYGGNAATASGLRAGTYSVTVTDANLCKKTETVTITEPEILTASVSQTNVSCKNGNDGTATVIASGGTKGYTYSWSPSGGMDATATNLSAGTYTVTITDYNSCSATEKVTITEPNALSVSKSQVNISCHNGNNGLISVSVTGGAGPYTYLWSPSGDTAATVENLSAGIYNLTITDANSCMATETFTITEPEALSAIVTASNVSCYNGTNGSATVNVSGGTGTYTYNWMPNGGTNATATGLVAGTYTITVTDQNSCSVTQSVEIAQPDSAVNLTTANVSAISFSGASLSGTASSGGNTDKGECLTEVGFVYALNTNPTVSDTKINLGSSLGTFTVNLADLRGNRTYYVRTYARNSNGFVNYGNEISFTTQKYTLDIKAATGHTKVYGTADPVFDYTASGFVNGDTNAVINGLLSRDAGENVGKYNIILGNITAGPDYEIVFTGAEFEITKANQTINWNQTLEFGCTDSNLVTLNAISDSGLPVSYSISNTAIGNISGSELTITNSGSTTITAFQNGDQNHNAAVSVTQPIEVSQPGLVLQQWEDVLFFDNKNNSFGAWQWYKNGAAIAGATRQYYNENEPLNGSYYVIATDKNGNAIKSCPIDLAGVSFSKKLKIFPNPVRPLSEFSLECDFSESQINGAEITIFDITGKLVQTVSNVKAKNQVISPAQSAIYIVVLKLQNGQQKTINLLVK